jgi:hypothetical protein
MAPRITLWAGIFLLACALAILPGELPAAEEPNFAGTWQLNDEQSDDAREKIRSAIGSSGGGRHGSFGGRRGSRGGGPGGDPQERMGKMLEAAERLTIAHRDLELTITDNNGRAHTFYTDGRSFEQQTPRGDAVDVTARWQGGQLVVERAGGRGGKVSETYELAPDGQQLFVTTRIENRRFEEPVVIRRVYDAVAESGPRSAPAPDPRQYHA